MSDPVQQFIDKNSAKARIYQHKIEEMLNDREGLFDYAEDTLKGILDYIHENNSITPKQIQAIENIKLKPTEQYGW